MMYVIKLYSINGSEKQPKVTNVFIINCVDENLLRCYAEKSFNFCFKFAIRIYF